MAFATQTEICNLALYHIGQKSISIITDTNSPEAIVCNKVWSNALREALRANDWGFARVLAQLAESATFDADTLEAYGYTKAYVYPSNCLAIRNIWNAATADKGLGEKYERVYDSVNAEEVILTNCDDAYIKYTYNLTDVSKFDHNFVTAFSYRLAAELAKPLTGDDNLGASMIKLFNGAVGESQRLAASEGNPQENKPNPIVESRG